MPELSNPTVIAAGTLLLSIFVLVGGSLLWLGRIANQVEQLGKRVDRLDERVEQIEQGMRAEMRALREDMRAEMRESREDMRRNHEQLLAALAGHTHDEAGQSVFRSPL